MLSRFLEDTQNILKKNEPFALGTVIRREAPSSGKVGDKALINKYGEIIGWAGGGCIKGILIKEAEDAIRSGRPRLVKIGKNVEKSNQEGIMEYKMTCQSEGTVEIFVEPILPKPHIVVIGKSEIAKSLIRLASAINYRTTSVTENTDPQTFEKADELVTETNLSQVATTPSSFIIVATQGEGDEKALSESLKKDRAFLGFVASRKKYTTVKNYLISSGFSKEEVEKIASPVGIDIHAKKPDEVAISILAEIIQHLNTHTNEASFQKFEKKLNLANDEKTVDYYTNPVCGVLVDKNNPKHIVEYKGHKVYFCCDGCKVKFDAEPEKYIKAIC